MKNSKLYAITTEPVNGYNFETMVESAIKGGADIVQYRDTTDRSDAEKLKIIKNLKNLTQKYGKILIVNNRIDLAILGNADGVHIGQDDVSIFEVRNFCASCGKKKFIIGVSTHSLEQALTAEKNGADYVGIGPLFATPTKPTYKPIGQNLALEVQKTLKIPAFAIGNINFANIDELIKIGINRIAVVREIFHAKNIEESTKKLKEIMLNN
jgi:thiamine-phosphate pyrophosphorylase